MGWYVSYLRFQIHIMFKIHTIINISDLAVIIRKKYKVMILNQVQYHVKNLFFINYLIVIYLSSFVYYCLLFNPYFLLLNDLAFNYYQNFSVYQCLFILHYKLYHQLNHIKISCVRLNRDHNIKCKLNSHMHDILLQDRCDHIQDHHHLHTKKY